MKLWTGGEKETKLVKQSLLSYSHLSHVLQNHSSDMLVISLLHTVSETTFHKCHTGSCYHTILGARNLLHGWRNNFVYYANNVEMEQFHSDHT